MIPSKANFIRLELSTVCQLKCPVCANIQETFKETLGSGFLSFDHFRKLITTNPEIGHIELSNYGEVFLNPYIDDILKYAFQRDVRLYVINGSNFNSIRRETLENIVRYRLRQLVISIDGADQETYSAYRINGSFQKVIQNIETLNAFKQKHRSKWPVAVWQFIPFKHNIHQIETARRHARRLKMTFILKQNWHPDFAPDKSGHVDKNSGDKKTREYAPFFYLTFCSQLWKMPQINWDGKLLGCCINHWGDFGNAFEAPLVESLNRGSLKAAKRMLLGGDIQTKTPCSSCFYYVRLKEWERRLLRVWLWMPIYNWFYVHLFRFNKMAMRFQLY